MSNLMVIKIAFCFLTLSCSSLILNIGNNYPIPMAYYTTANKYTTTTKPYTTTTTTTTTTTKLYATTTKTTTEPYTTTTIAATQTVKANIAVLETSSATTTSTVYATATPSLTRNSFDIQQMACLVNYQRKLKGAPPLTISSGINQIALGQSIFQAQNQQMTHSGANGSTLIDRFDAANYPGRYVAENVAWNQKSAAEVVQAWVNSPGHYANMISPLYTEFGCTSVNWYWTFDFGSSTGKDNIVPNCSGYNMS